MVGLFTITLICEQLYFNSLYHLTLGHAFDGDARRRKLMMQIAYSGTETIPVANFLIRSTPGRNYLMDQDYIHNIKKLVNPLDHNSKDLLIGKHLFNACHMNVFYWPLAHFTSADHFCWIICIFCHLYYCLTLTVGEVLDEAWIIQSYYIHAYISINIFLFICFLCTCTITHTEHRSL